MSQHYQITREERTTLIRGDNIPRQGYRVWFTIPATKTYDYVEVEEAEHTPDRIKELIEAKVNETLAIFGL